MQAGLLDRFITIEKETTSVNEVGTPIETYAKLKDCYSTIKYTSGGTSYNEGAQAFTDIDFSIRYDSNVNFKCRILFDSEYYKIMYIEKIGRKDGMRLKCIKWDT
jgi:SPP1 family predicted phage head-tail adaptor